MKDFTLPANIKQIGSIEGDIRIYMEDYVCTFLHQYAASGGYEERIAYLVGRHILIDSQPFLFIAGAIYGMYAEEQDGFIRFTNKSAEYAEAMLETHFPGQEIVGWMQSQPSYGTYLNQQYGAYHLRQFTKPHHVLFVMDPLERTNAFYMANPKAVTPADRVLDIGGYFVYYEKNINMHEYMLANKAMDTGKPPTFVAPSAFGDDGDDGDDEMQKTTAFSADPEEVIRRHKANRLKQRTDKAEQKQKPNMLAGLCAVLFVASFVLGVGLIRNQDRIDRMEGEIGQLANAHRNLFAQISSLEFTPVFAETNPEAAVESSAHFYTHVYDEQRAEMPGEIQPETRLGTQLETQPAPGPQTEPQPPPAQQISEPLREPPNQTAAAPLTYIIQPGDSLLAISLHFFGDITMVNEILALNGLTDPDHIVAGSTIILPQR